MGSLSDGTRSRFGRRRPWMFLSVPLYAASFVLLWSPPETMSGEPLRIWILVMLLLCTTGFTGWIIPHLALGVELSKTDELRHAYTYCGQPGPSTTGMAPAGAFHRLEVDQRLAYGLARVAKACSPSMKKAICVPPACLWRPFCSTMTLRRWKWISGRTYWLGECAVR